MSEEEEIFGKIEEQHRQGAHVTGPQAGCRLCAALTEQKNAQGDVSAVEDGLSADEAIDELAMRRAVAAAAAETSRRSPTVGVPSVDEISSWTHTSHPKTLGDVALGDAQQALDDLDALVKQGIVIANEKQALVHAQVGVVRALAGIEQQLGRIADYLEPPSLPDAAEEIQILREAREKRERDERTNGGEIDDEPPEPPAAA